MPAPVITSASSANAPLNSVFNYEITASNNPTSYSVIGKPSWLELYTQAVGGSAPIAELSGTPTALGDYSMTLRATNADGTGQLSFTISVRKVQEITFELPFILRQDTPDSDPYFSQAQIFDLFKELTTIVIDGQYYFRDPVLYEPIPLRISASSSSGLIQFTYFSSDTSRATITDTDLLTFPPALSTVAPQVVTIEARQAGDDEWFPASKELVLDPSETPADAHILTITAPSSLSLNEEQPFTVVSNKSLAPIILETNGAVLSFVGAGSTVIDGQTFQTWQSGTKVKAVGPGAAFINARQPGNETISFATVAAFVTVALQAQTVTFNVPAVVWEEGMEVLLTATASSGLPIVFSTSNAAVAEFVAGGLLRINSRGSVFLTASQAGDSVFAPASKVVEIGIGSRSQIIVFEEFGPQQFGDAQFAPRAYATSGLPLTFASSNPSVASVIGGTVIIVGVGSASITASQSGNAFWQPASNVTRTLVVSKGVPSISATVPPFVFVGDNNRVKISATASNGEEVVFAVASTSIDKLKIVKEGDTYYLSGVSESTVQGIVIASVAATGRYESASVRFPVRVGRRSQSIGGDLFIVRRLSDEFVDLKLQSTTKLPLTLALTGGPGVLNGTRVSFNSVGQITVLANQPGNERFKPATPVEVRIVVERGRQRIAFAPVPTVLEGQQIALSATASGGTPVVFYSSAPEVVSISGNVATGVRQGGAFILAVTLGNANFEPAAAVQPVGVLVPRADSVGVPPSGVIDAELFASSAASQAFSGAATVLSLPSVKDTENFNSVSVSPPTSALGLELTRGVQDQENFNPLIPSSQYTGVSFDMKVYPAGGDHENGFSSPAVSPEFEGEFFVMPVGLVGDGSAYEASLPSALANGGFCKGVKYDGRNEFEVYASAPPLLTNGFLLYVSGTSGKLLWRQPDLTAGQIGGRYVLL